MTRLFKSTSIVLLVMLLSGITVQSIAAQAAAATDDSRTSAVPCMNLPPVAHMALWPAALGDCWAAAEDLTAALAVPTARGNVTTVLVSNVTSAAAPDAAAGAPAETSAPAAMLIQPSTDAVLVRAEPVDGSVLDVVQPGQHVEVMDSPEAALSKIGVYGEWLQVRSPDGQRGYTAAWLYKEADRVASPAAAATPLPSASITPPMYIVAASNDIRIRALPVDGGVVDVIPHGQQVEVIESSETARTKLGTNGAWLKVRSQNGVEGYTAAWLYSAADEQAALPSPQPGTGTGTGDANSLYLLPQNDGIRIRAAPVDGLVMDVVNRGQAVEVIEPVERARTKIGVNGSWVQVRSLNGVEGYTAAWLYTIADLTPPSSADPAAQVELPPLDATTDPAALNVLPAEQNAIPDLTAIAPLENSITALGIAPDPAPQPQVQPASAGASIITSPTISSSESASAAAPAAAPAADSAAASEPVNPVEEPAGPLVNNITPITIKVKGDSTVESAALAINNYPLAMFSAPPFEYDLDNMLLSDGEYKLTFTVTDTDGLVVADDLYFDVAVLNDTPARASSTAVDTATGTTGTAAATGTADPASTTDPGRRILTINGQQRPFTFDFSADAGLVPATLQPAAAETTTTSSPRSLTDVMGEPILTLIPTPARNFLSEQHPTAAAIITLIMVLILVPQGLFTLYWMTYTWNNPEAADAYRSPREFADPQHSFTALLPARHEADVIKDTIRAVDRIDYPEHLKEILILIRDEDDDATIRASQEAINELGNDNIRLITFTDGPRNKPNGLNKGLREARNDVVCIFDAEDEPHADIYNVVNTVMLRDNADVVQSGVQLMNFRSSWFAVFTVLEYFFWFKSGLHTFTRKFRVTPLGGNTVFVKRHWLERLHGWDTECLTEDADIGLRLTKLGAKIQIVYDAEHATQEETPATAESFIKQRTRWVQGFFQVFFKGDWLQLPSFTQKIVAVYILLNSLLQAAMVLFLPIGLYLALTQDLPIPLALLSYVPIYILIMQLITGLVGIREFADAYGERLPAFFTLRMIVFYYPYQIMLSIAAFRAVIRFLGRQQAWEKTSHANLHRQSQVSGVA